MLDRSKVNVPFATPAGASSPLMLRWLLMCEHPITHTLWIAKATPRAWLAEGQTFSSTALPSAYGRLSFQFRSEIESARRVHVNVSLPPSWVGGNVTKPAGGVVIRLRAPHANITIVAATMGGVAVPFNSSTETLSIPRKILCCQSCGCLPVGSCCVSRHLMTQLQSVIVSYKM